MYCLQERTETEYHDYMHGKLPRRYVEEMELIEVSIIDNRFIPAYAGTSIEARADGKRIAERRAVESHAITEDRSQANAPDYSEYENKIKTLKGEK